MAHLPCEIQREIFKQLHARDLIRCKSVCKSWLSLISDPLFIKLHLNHQYHNDCNNKRFAHRRIIMSKEPDDVLLPRGNISTNFFYLNDRYLIGSSNGLVCVSPNPAKYVVINPSTREVKNVTKSRNILETGFPCLGFGYDSKNDDYKIVLGFQKGENNTCFHVFSLRYNIWKVIAEINYVFISRAGVLCEGGLHWLAHDTSPEKKTVVLSLRFWDEKFMEVPMPDGARYNKLYNRWKSSRMRLGNMNGCLCLFWLTSMDIWVMNKERSWEYFGSVHKIEYDAVHMIKQLKNYIPNKRPLCHQVSPHDYCLIDIWMFLSVPTYVESLVSPHFHKKPQRKRQAASTIKSNKVIKKANTHAVPYAHGNASTGGVENLMKWKL